MFHPTWEECCERFFPGAPAGVCKKYETCTPDSAPGTTTEPTATAPTTTDPPGNQCKYKWHLDAVTNDGCSNSEAINEVWLSDQLVDRMFFAELTDCCRTFFPSSGGDCPVEDTGCVVASSDGGGVDNDDGGPDDTEANQCKYRWHLDKITQQKCSNSEQIYEGWLDPMIVDRMFFAKLDDCCWAFFPGIDCQVEDTGCVVI